MKRLLIAFMSSLILVPVTAVEAEAACAEFPASAHCHAITDFNGGASMGEVSGTLTATSINATSTSRTNEEQWTFLPSCADGTCWIEQGEKYGKALDGGYYPNAWFYEYVTPSQPGGVFVKTSLGFTTGTNYGWTAHYHGSDQWFLVRNGTQYATVSGAAGPSTHAQAGIEFTDAFNYACGTQNSLGYVVSGGSGTHVGWATGSVKPTTYVDPPATAALANYTNFSFRLNC